MGVWKKDCNIFWGRKLANTSSVCTSLLQILIGYGYPGKYWNFIVVVIENTSITCVCKKKI
jgi:hypothetical protein